VLDDEAGVIGATLMLVDGRDAADSCVTHNSELADECQQGGNLDSKDFRIGLIEFRPTIFICLLGLGLLQSVG
jgi:hypothetical protein